MGMIGVDKIGEIRRAYFEQDRSIKEIVRTLLVSRATVRKVIRGHKTEFKYARGVQPTPKLGDWVEALTEILGTEANLPKRERRSTQRLFEELRGRGYRRSRQRASLRQVLARRTRPGSGSCLCADELCAWGSLPVRLEPRDDHAPRSAADGQGGAHEAVAQPHALCSRLLPRDSGAGVRRA